MSVRLRERSERVREANDVAWEIAKAGKPEADPGKVADLAVMAGSVALDWNKHAGALTEAMARELNVLG